MKEIQLTQDYKTVVDDRDYEELSKHKWCCGIITGRYARAERKEYKNGGKTILMSRQIMGFPEGKMVDHANHDTLDNRRCNLRICTNAENMRNQKMQHCKKSSQYKGVSLHKHARKWYAQIDIDGQRIYLGSFKTELGAAVMYNLAARKYHGEFACLNEISVANLKTIGD